MRWPVTLSSHDVPDQLANQIFSDMRKLKPSPCLGHVGRRRLPAWIETDRLKDLSPKMVWFAHAVIIILMIIDGS